jgi:hypothetical protein
VLWFDDEKDDNNDDTDNDENGEIIFIMPSYFQLTTQLGVTDVFRGFDEGKIQFDPTYRFDAGTDVYDTR